MKKRIIQAIAIFTILAILVIGFRFLQNKNVSPYTQQTVYGFIGSEKNSFLSDPEVVKILKDKYSLTVEYKTKGSIEMTQENLSNVDFLWPSNSAPPEILKQQGVTGFKTETIFNSPIVLYTWNSEQTDVTKALINANLVEMVDNVYYLTDMQLLANLLIQEPSWTDLGLSQLYGNFAVISTDPTKSNSGNMFYCLLSAMFNNGTVVDDSSVETVLPAMYNYYQSLGFLEDGSSKLFERFITNGVGQNPIIAGYESQVIEFILENPEYKDRITNEISILYPKPTIWASHPLISFTKAGDRLSTALQDPEIQQIAWKKHGFRTGIAGIENNPTDIGMSGMPDIINSVISLPKPQVMQRIIDYLTYGE